MRRGERGEREAVLIVVQGEETLFVDEQGEGLERAKNAFPDKVERKKGSPGKKTGPSAATKSPKFNFTGVSRSPKRVIIGSTWNLN